MMVCRPDLSKPSGLNDLTHQCVGADAPHSNDEAFGVQAVDQLARHRLRGQI
jgi:hypothetical protein